MLFSNIPAHKVKDKLVRIVEAAVYCLIVIGEKDISQDEQITFAYNELSEAMTDIIDEDISKHGEYDYILYRAKLKLRQSKARN